MSRPPRRSFTIAANSSSDVHNGVARLLTLEIDRCKIVNCWRHNEDAYLRTRCCWLDRVNLSHTKNCKVSPGVPYVTDYAITRGQNSPEELFRSRYLIEWARYKRIPGLTEQESRICGALNESERDLVCIALDICGRGTSAPRATPSTIEDLSYFDER